MDNDHSTASTEPDKAAMDTLGARLRLARQERGLELADVARETRVPMRFLSALERDDQENLPALPYTLGFVRACAKLLGIDPEAAVAQFKEERPVPSSVASHQVTLDVENESQLPSGRLVAFAVTLLVLIVVAALIWRSVQSSGVSKVAAVTAESAAVATGPILSNSAAPPVGEKPVVAAPPEATNPALSGTNAATVPPSAVNGTPAIAAGSPAAQPVATTPQAGAPAPAATTTATNSIILQAQADSWIKITSDDGKTIKMGLLKAGTSYSVPNQANLKLLTGNAGGLDIIVDGKHMPSLGQSGELAHIDLSPQGLSGLRPAVPARDGSGQDSAPENQPR